MNALGFWLLGSIAHATIFAIAGIAAYLAIRRLGPAAGSLAAGSSLVIMALVSAVVLSPWPRWWTWPVDRTEARATAVPAATEPSPAATEQGRSPGEAPERPTVEVSPVRPTFLSILIDELRRPAAASGSSTWGWREWIAAGFLASAVLGLARLGAGLREVGRLRSRSRPVHDPQLDDLLQVLRAELSCTRPVELREADELTTPATIGWRRPVLLLPFDWRDWDEDERRVVLSHELAHVRRGDFPAGVAAQLALAFHFYHPLAHWLAARLRLEQELAADAWGARLSGGKRSYLATLAQMALRRDGHPMTWPARAFLPSRDTFVRRIEMLKNRGPIGHVTLPLFARIATVAALAALGLIVAGLRGPAGESSALAQDRPTATPPDQADSFDPAFLPADARMMLVVRPESLLRRREVMSLVKSLKDPMLSGRLPVPPEDIRQLLLFWEAQGQAEPGPGGPRPFPGMAGLVLRLAKHQDWKASIAKLGIQGLQEVRHDGQPYLYAGGQGAGRWGYYTPDDRTLVAASEVALREIISDRNAPPARHAWDEAWQKVGKGQLMMAVDARWLRRELARAIPPGGAAEGLAVFSPLYEKAQSYAISLNATDRALTVDLVAAVRAAEDSKAVAETLRSVVTLGKNAVQGLRRDVDRQARLGEGPEWALQAADSLLEKARVDTTEGFVRLQSESVVDLAEGIRLLAPAVMTARAAAGRTQSVNNLKQIGLAFHNFAQANGHFPASANNDKGPFPYSWRVAILPYLDQAELYNQYRFNEPWDSPHNHELVDRMPATYAYPGLDGTPSSRSHASYFVFTGPSAIGGIEGGAKLEMITDGMSNSLLAVEAKREVPWTRPEDIPFDPNAAAPELGGFTPDGFNALFADGSVRHIMKSMDPTILKALITPRGGEVININGAGF